MDEPIAALLTIAAGLAAALVALILYLLTNTESAGFRLLPGDAKGWIGFWLRSLSLVVVVSIPLSFLRQMHPIVYDNLGSCALVLVITAAIFYPMCRGLSLMGILVACLGLLTSTFRSIIER